MRFFILFAAATAVTCSPALAQDASRFPGARLAVVAGVDATSADATYEDSAFPANNFRESESTTGLVYGVVAGYDLRISDGAYFGVEGSYEQADNKRCEEVFGGDAACFSLKRNWYAGVRGGTRVTPRTLFTLGAGYVNGRGRLSYTDPADPTGDFSISDDRGGWRASVGLEQRLNGNFFGQVEYRYSNYTDYKETDGTESYALGFQRHQVVAGLGVRF